MLFLTMTDPVALLAPQRGELSTAHGEQVVGSVHYRRVLHQGRIEHRARPPSGERRSMN